MHWFQSQLKQRDGLLTHHPFSLLSSRYSSSSSSPPLRSPFQTESTSSSSSGSKISPDVLIIIVILAVIFFISGLLHLLVRYLMKNRSPSSISHSNRYQEMSGSGAFQRQLQQLFHLHDSGLDQAIIDALPVFLYKEIKGLKEPFDCAVCLFEFSEQDKLRLLPLCSHAFHVDCIDTWLLTNSTCPLCRGTLFTPGFSIENTVFDFDDSRDEDKFSGNISIGIPRGSKPGENEIVSQKRMLPVRLGRFRDTNDSGGGGEKEVGETSNSTLDARRCYSMGSFQYVEADSDLQVAVCPIGGRCNGGALVKGRGAQNENYIIEVESEGKRINIGSKGESFSVSKIWMWSKKGKLPSSSDTQMVSSSVGLSLQWNGRIQAT